MKISVTNRGDIQVLELSGELDYHSSPELREKLISCKVKLGFDP